jgi:hypothetical protein
MTDARINPNGTFADRAPCTAKEDPMPKFFINFQNANRLVKDDTGIDLPSLEQARETALISAREILADNIKSGAKNPMEAIIVTDESGQELMAISANDLLPEPLKR